MNGYISLAHMVMEVEAQTEICCNFFFFGVVVVVVVFPEIKSLTNSSCVLLREIIMLANWNGMRGFNTFYTLPGGGGASL